MVNVLTGILVWDCIKETTVEESIPPERNAPKGTSAIIRLEIASWRSESKTAPASSFVPLKRLVCDFSIMSLADQYG